MPRAGSHRSTYELGRLRRRVSAVAEEASARFASDSGDDLSVRLLDLDPTRITQVAQVLPDAETWLDPEPADAHSLLLLIASNATRATYSAVIYGIWRWYGLIASVASHIATDSVIFWFVAHHAFYVSG